ncbi:hypothetical protein A1OE_1055 [Candidatus Endolissoclinum faulkneri L2]|uniref:Uncharacterized protein n=1 Tax=Candidatus Endolissoclinum faulkneri L2 TaxID=1193729 RepID=K7Z5A8_9PROT|nr:hypothetical protein A1OE_1055 [Candidatus Endolissoclinum faulkneri L2]
MNYIIIDPVNNITTSNIIYWIMLLEESWQEIQLKLNFDLYRNCN